MPLTGPAFRVGPYRFTNREYFIVRYQACRQAGLNLGLGEVVFDYPG
ncbi:hypothetical protein [Azoarcus sp. DN11]|nr:hypothetical protein [Azoarcus sp. DN11]